jgi:predicted lipase
VADAAGEADWVLLASAILAAIFAPLAIRLYRYR